MEMEWVRAQMDLATYREVVQGAAWDPLWLFAAVGIGFVVLHALYKLVRPSRY